MASSNEIRSLAAKLSEKPGRWGYPEIEELVHAAQDQGGITADEEAALRTVLADYGDRMELQAQQSLAHFLDADIAPYRVGPDEPMAKRAGLWMPAVTDVVPAVALDAVALTPTGEVRLKSAAGVSQTNAERAQALYCLARIVDHASGNIFAAPRSKDERLLQSKLFGDTKLDPAFKEGLVGTLRDALGSAKAGVPLPDGLDDAAVLQLRSSTATVLLSLMEALPSGELKDQAFARYRDAARAEPNQRLRESMVFWLDNARPGFSADQQKKIDALFALVAPTAPPYADIFKGGSNVLNVSMQFSGDVDGPDPFERLVTDSLKKYGGYRIVRDDPGYRVLEGALDGPAGKVKVVIDAKIDQGSLFQAMADPNTAVVIYSGHSNYGRRLRDDLRFSPEQKGAKIILVDACASKDDYWLIREKYPEATVIPTFDSSMFSRTNPDAQSEGSQAVLGLLKGLAARKDWAALSQSLNDGLHQGHPLPINYLTPVNVPLLWRFLDSDHDGQANAVDRLVDFKVLKVAENTETEFAPMAGRPTPLDLLDGSVADRAALTLDTFCNYNDVLSHLNGLARVVGDGYFTPGPGEAKQIVKFSEDKELNVHGKAGDVSTLRMQVNANYAHMSEEALRAVACYELNKFVATRFADKYFGSAAGWPQGFSRDATIRLMGLVFAASDLVFDMDDDDAVDPYWSPTERDRQVWKNLLRYAGAPDIEPDALFKFIRGIGEGKDTHEDSTGSPRVVQEWLRRLKPAQIAALKK